MTASLEISGRKGRGNPNPKLPGSSRTSVWLSTAVYDWMRKRIEAAGGDPTQIPKETEPRFMRLPEVTRICGIAPATVYKWGASGGFPRPISLA